MTAVPQAAAQCRARDGDRVSDRRDTHSPIGMVSFTLAATTCHMAKGCRRAHASAPVNRSSWSAAYWSASLKKTPRLLACSAVKSLQVPRRVAERHADRRWRECVDDDDDVPVAVLPFGHLDVAGDGAHGASSQSEMSRPTALLTCTFGALRTTAFMRS